ncbi:MAG: hypothetical protein KBA31_22385 [Alphaproteobacteria bacterium]|nr:hypothetical protein [Alphaproteobacteria bacterium]
MVETLELGRLRQRFATQFQLARYLNPDIRFPTSEGDRTEVQFLASLALFAGNVLVRIWNSKGSTSSERVRRAEWVWQNLQTGQVSFVPISGSSDSDARRSIATVTYASLLINGLQVQGDGGRLDLERLGEYYRWAFSMLDTVSRNDKKLVDAVLNDVGGRLASFIGSDEPPKGFAPSQLIQTILSRWPEDWYQEILEVPNLRDKLKPQYQEIITLPNGTTFLVVEFAKALLAAFDGVPQAIQTLQGDGAEVSVTGDRTLVTLAGKATYQIGGTEMGFAASASDTQARALEVAARAYDLPDREKAELSRRLRECAGPEERLSVLQELKDQSYAHNLQLVRDALANAPRVGAHLFAPPSPSTLLRYLHMEASQGDALEAFQKLLAERGATEALKRFAGLPTLRLDASADLLALKPTTKGAKPPSPMYALRLATIARHGSDPAEAELRAQNLAEALKEQSGLFWAVLKWTARLACGKAEWLALPPELRRSLLWVHADLVVGCLMTGGGKATELQEYFDAQDRLDPWQYMSSFRESVAEVVQFEHLAALQAWILSRLFEANVQSSTGTESLARFRELIGTQHAGMWRPHFIVVARPDGATGFQQSDAVAKLRDAGVFTDADTAVYSRAEIWAALVARGLTSAMHDDLSVLPLFRPQDLEESQLSQAAGIASVYFRGLKPAWDSDEYQLWTSYICGLLGRQGCRDEFANFLRRAVYAARMQGNIPGRDRCIASLCEAVFNFAINRPANPRDRLTTTLFGLEIISSLWPDATAQVRELLAILSRHVPPDQAAELGDLHLKLREVP